METQVAFAISGEGNFIERTCLQFVLADAGPFVISAQVIGKIMEIGRPFALWQR